MNICDRHLSGNDFQIKFILVISLGGGVNHAPYKLDPINYSSLNLLPILARANLWKSRGESQLVIYVALVKQNT